MSETELEIVSTDTLRFAADVVSLARERDLTIQDAILGFLIAAVFVVVATSDEETEGRLDPEEAKSLIGSVLKRLGFSFLNKVH